MANHSSTIIIGKVTKPRFNHNYETQNTDQCLTKLSYWSLGGQNNSTENLSWVSAKSRNIVAIFRPWFSSCFSLFGMVVNWKFRNIHFFHKKNIYSNFYWILKKITSYKLFFFLLLKLYSCLSKYWYNLIIDRITSLLMVNSNYHFLAH